MAEKKKLILIDGHATLHKAYHAIRDSLTNARGEPTSAVYGFLNTFFRLQELLSFHHIVVVFDPPGKVFRHEVFKEYKANRPPAPEDLKLQGNRVQQALELMGVPVVIVSGFEADDVIASLAYQAVASGGEAVVCSSDKDLLQIASPGIVIFREHLQKTEWLNETGVMEKLGVRPDQVPAYLGLVGDSSDNIPGVPGVGKKTAVELLREYDTMDAILAAAPEMKKKKLSQNLQEFASVARLSEQLATLATECMPEFSWEDYEWVYEPSAPLRDFYREMNFQGFLKAMGGDTVDERETEYAIVSSRAGLERVAQAIRKARLAAIDTETTDLDTFKADLVGISISWKKNQAVYIPVGHTNGSVDLAREDLREILSPLLRDPDIRWVAHHWNYDYKILKRAKLDPGCVRGDTLIAAYLLQPDRSSSLGLKALALSILGIQMTEIGELIGDGDDLVTMAGVSIEQTANYACQDADVTLQLHNYFDKELKKAGLVKLYEEVEVPLINVLAEMELEGIRIDTDHFRKLSRDAEKLLKRLTGEVYEIAGCEFNINSPKQVGEVLFEKLKLPTGKKGKSGAYSTDVTVLEGLKNQHPLPAKLLEYREVDKLKSTYIDPLPGLINSRTGRVHTSFNQTIAATGRLSSSNPNLQNIPIRTEAGREIRRGFVARGEGWKLMSADYSQIELRILAHLSGDEALREAFQSGTDVHTMTASKVFGVPAGQVDSTMRGQAKVINFGIIYGMTEFRLARDLDISRDKARQFIADYFTVYSGVKDFIEKTKEQAREQGFVTTLLGRRRFVPDINSRNGNQRALAERVAVNTPIQGTSADMIKVAMLRVDEALRGAGGQTRMLLQVHDELIFDVPEEEIPSVQELVGKEMAAALTLDVPIKVDIEVGTNWAEAK